MGVITTRATIYFDARLHEALRKKSAETSHTMSEIVNDAVAIALEEDAEDIAAFKERAHEPLIAFDDVVRELKHHGKI